MYTAHSDELTFTPWKKEFLNYSLASLKKDLLAGLEVALLTIPQAIAYTLVAGLPVSCGLYAAIFSAIAATFLGSSKYLIVGPVNALAIMMQAGTAEILFSYYRNVSPQEQEVLAFEIMTQIALLSGFFHLLTAFFRLGRFTQFVSHSVIVGYIAGSALAIITNQLFVVTAMPTLQGSHSLFEKLSYFFTHFNLTNLLTFAIGMGSFLSLMVLKKLNPRIPSAACVLLGSALLLFAINISPYAHFGLKVEVIGSTMDRFSIWPILQLPSFNTEIMNHVLSTSFAIALLSLIETTCTVKSIAATAGSSIAINQEILSVGVSNLVSSCTGSLPVSVSNSRSQLNVQLGAKTRLSAICSALLVAGIVGYLGAFVNAIPLPALSALLFITAFSLVDVKQVALCLKSTTADAFVLITTFIACIFLNLDTAFYLGVILSISLYLKKAAMPELVEYAIEDSGELKSLDLPQAYLQKAIRVIKVEGELFLVQRTFFTQL